MNTDERILVIFLSAALGVFLLLGIALLIMSIQIVNRIRRISEKAEDFAEKAEAVGDFFQKTAGPATLAKALARTIKSYTKNHEDKEKN